MILWLHIGAAGAWLGANATQFLARQTMRKAGPESEAAWWRTTVVMARYLYTPAAIIALLTGVELVRRGPWSYGDAFVSVGFVMVAISAVLGIRIFGPQGELAASQLTAGQDAGATRSKLAAFGALDTALLLFTIYAMVSKLGA